MHTLPHLESHTDLDKWQLLLKLFKKIFQDRNSLSLVIQAICSQIESFFSPRLKHSSSDSNTLKHTVSSKKIKQTILPEHAILFSYFWSNVTIIRWAHNCILFSQPLKEGSLGDRVKRLTLFFSLLYFFKIAYFKWRSILYHFSDHCS